MSWSRPSSQGGSAILWTRQPIGHGTGETAAATQVEDHIRPVRTLDDKVGVQPTAPARRERHRAGRQVTEAKLTVAVGGRTTVENRTQEPVSAADHVDAHSRHVPSLCVGCATFQRVPRSQFDAETGRIFSVCDQAQFAGIG